MHANALIPVLHLGSKTLNKLPHHSDVIFGVSNGGNEKYHSPKIYSGLFEMIRSDDRSETATGG